MRLIDADAYADHLEKTLMETAVEDGLKSIQAFLIAALVASVVSDLRDKEITPTIDVDMGEYSDRLYKLAYERGKRVGRMEVIDNGKK